MRGQAGDQRLRFGLFTCWRSAIGPKVVPWFTSLVSAGPGNLFEDFRDYCISYYNAGSNEFNSGDNPPGSPFGSPYFSPFPFAGLGVTYDPATKAGWNLLQQKPNFWQFSRA